MIKVAVVGGGIFGVTAAIHLAENGYSVDLFEKQQDILRAASGINQYRLHRGYHYPRSPETALSCKKSEQSFVREYREAIINDVEHYYCIAKEGSLTSAENYLKFCKTYNLEYEITDLDLMSKPKIALCLKVKESIIDPDKLRLICLKKLKAAKVNVYLNAEADEARLKNYDFVVLCAYAGTNSLLRSMPEIQQDYQFELCEKPVLKLPKNFQNKSIVVMDGPFMCIDPLGATGLSVMGNVVHAIYQTNIGKYPQIDERFKPLLNQGIIQNPPLTNFKHFIDSAVEFMPEIKKAEHIGSMFTIRTVLPYKDVTDERPTIVKKINDKMAAVFSGKIGNCVEAAEEVRAIINSVSN